MSDRVKRFIMSSAAAAVLFAVASVYAYHQRGYEAVGGEYLLLLLPLWVELAVAVREGEEDEVRYPVPFDYDAWELAAPEDPEEGRVCGDCLFCKDAGRLLACVVEAFDAEDEDGMYGAGVHVVEATQEACDRWVDSESGRRADVRS